MSKPIKRGDVKIKRQPKTIDKVKEWLKLVCKKGEIVEVFSAPNVLVIRKLEKAETFSYQVKYEVK